MNIVAYGGGTDSTAMLIECYKRNIKIDLILFADTGGERPETYKLIKLFNQWLIDHDMPEIIIVEKGGRSETLEENCLRMKMLPSIAYGFKSCSLKYKVEPQNKYCNNNEECKNALKVGKLTKFIGYDASEDRRATIKEDKKYKYFYPLIEWNIDRDQCLDIIKNAGLPLPGKSACFFCPSSRVSEIRALKLQHPELADRAIKMEENAELTSIKGLGRSYSWKNLLATDDMFDDNYIDIACGCYDG